MNRWPKYQALVVLQIAMSILFLSGCILVSDPTPIPATNTPTAADIIIPATATTQNEATDVPATAVPTETVLTETATPVETATSMPTFTNTPLPSQTATQLPSATPFPYGLQIGTPAYINNFRYPAAGCNWIGVAGQVFNTHGDAQTNLVVLVTGVYNAQAVNAVGVTGTVAGDTYGPGGYEIQIGNEPIASEDQLSIQVFDLAGFALTEAFSFDTSAACDENLIIINFSP